MYDKRILVGAAVLLLAARGTCQKGPHPLMGADMPAPAAGTPQLGPDAPVKTPAGPAAFLTAVPQAGEETVGLAAVRWNAGVIDEGHESHVDHTFTLKNTRVQAVTVSKLRGSCGCETLFLTKSGKEVPTVSVAPGETVQVKVSVALRAGQSGEMHKYAWAYGPETSSPPLNSMEIALTVRAPVVFEPNVLDFGTVSIGVSKSVSITVTADASALIGKSLPIPVSSKASVIVTPVGAETTVERDGKAARSRRFQVTLSEPVEAGSVSGNISLPVPVGSALAGVSVPLVGTISGTMTAQPKSVFFGSIPSGQGVTREVLLSEPAVQRGKGLSVSSGSPWLTARVQEAAGTKPLLVITLKPGAPVGVVQTQVVITAASGERLSIPVVGEILGHHS